MKKLFKILSLMLLTLLMPYTIVSATEGPTHVINGSNYKLEDDDLSFFKTLLKDKNIVGIGESTHGTKEFFEMKHRMFKFLVEEMDFRAFTMEESGSSIEKINQYINGIDGDPKELVKGLYSPWQNEDFLPVFYQL